MKTNEDILARLNTRISGELTAVIQATLHAQMCDYWGYRGLYRLHKQRVAEEMLHAERLTARVLELEGTPQAVPAGQVVVGVSVEEQLQVAFRLASSTVHGYQDDLRLVNELNDHHTAALLNALLQEDAEYLGHLQAQLEQIRVQGMNGYLAGPASAVETAKLSVVPFEAPSRGVKRRLSG